MSLVPSTSFRISSPLAIQTPRRSNTAVVKRETHIGCGKCRPQSSPKCFSRRPSLTFRGKHAFAIRALKEEEDVEMDVDKRRSMENELRDPGNFLEYFLPRPIRLVFFGGGAFGCFTASLVTLANIIGNPALARVEGTFGNLSINVVGLIVFSALFIWDSQRAEKRIERRKEIRTAQISFGDREVYINEKGEKMSKLKEVDDDWILRRLERWGKRDGMPFVGPEKGKILKQLVEEQKPQFAVEVGTLCGYSAILIAQALPEGSQLLSYESDWKWFLVAKRFLWQASQGSKNTKATQPIKDKVDVQLGDARTKLQNLPSDSKIDFLFLDGLPREYLEYLQMAEDKLAPGALIVADNAGVFAQGGLKNYLEYVRSSPRYNSRFIESTLEWRDDVADGMEVSEFLG